MNNKITVKLIFIIVIFASCSSLIQKSYFVNPPNVNCFQSEKEKNIKFSQGINHFEVQFDWTVQAKCLLWV
jgi:hypothetical protein